MSKLSRDNLYSLEEYAEMRPQYREKVMQHKNQRRVFLGENATLYFESEMTMRYQVQEMLRIEKIFDKAGIEEEIEAYNPLIPDGKNWKATFMIEISDEEERKAQLAKMIGIEEKIYVQIDDFEPVWAIADEDLERDTEEKTSSVHFLRFELSDDMILALRNGQTLSMGISHPAYTVNKIIDDKAVRESLISDLQ
ncbi:MAG: DUF3501 family protein [Gammaproteobacteria bacterium]|nr:DUF3501 family protein [Gammaproteobacteria bacterium]